MSCDHRFVMLVLKNNVKCFAGILGQDEISAFSIMFQVEGFAWMVRSLITTSLKSLDFYGL